MLDFPEQYFLKCKKDPPRLHIIEDKSQHGSGHLHKCQWCPETTPQLLWPELKGSTVPGISARGNI